LAVAALATLSPTWASAGDEEVAQQVAAALRNSGNLVNYSISVQYQEGITWLTGRVSSHYQMALAVAMAKKLPYVSQVVNQLEIMPTRIQQVSYPQRAGPMADSNPPVAVKPESKSSWDGIKSFFRPAGSPAEGMSTGISKMSEVVRYKRRPSIVQRDELLFGTTTLSMPMQNPMASASDRYAGNAIRSTRHVGYDLQRQYSEPNSLPPSQSQRMPMARHSATSSLAVAQRVGGGPIPAFVTTAGRGISRAAYDQPHMPAHAWPSYAAYPNYAGVTYPQQYSPTAWPYIGPFYPYPQVPLGWRKVTLEWDDGWWQLDFSDKKSRHGCLK
jgi:hypothetical protein